MPGRDEIRELILGAAEGATGCVEVLGAAGVPAAVEDFDVEVTLADGVAAVVRFTVVAGAAARPADAAMPLDGAARSVA